MKATALVPFALVLAWWLLITPATAAEFRVRGVSWGMSPTDVREIERGKGMQVVGDDRTLTVIGETLLGKDCSVRHTFDGGTLVKVDYFLEGSYTTFASVAAHLADKYGIVPVEGEDTRAWLTWVLDGTSIRAEFILHATGKLQGQSFVQIIYERIPTNHEVLGQYRAEDQAKL